MKQSSYRQPWTQNQDQILDSLVKKYGAGNWVLISQKMQTKANTFSRSGKQCRERWHNHLDPSIKKNQWTTQEQKIMFDAHKNFGNKWAQIASRLKGRTDNDIKNHFYSTLRKSLRRLSKMLGQKNSTQKIKKIRPSTLSQLFDSPTDKKSKQTSQALFKFILQRQNMNVKSLSKKDRQILQNLIDDITSTNQKNEQNQNSPTIIKQIRQKSSRLRSSAKKTYFLDDNIMQQQKISLKSIPNDFDSFINYKTQQKIQQPRLRGRKSKLSQKQNKYFQLKENNIQQMQIQIPLTKLTSVKKSSLFQGPFTSINDQAFEKNLFNYFDEKLIKLNSIKKQSQGQQYKLFNELMIPQNISSKRSSSSGLSDMKKFMSYNNNDRISIYVTPKHPTPGCGQTLFKTWNFAQSKISKQIIDQQTQNIKKQIQRNIKSTKN